MNTRQVVISDHIVELHYERSTKFGQDVRCSATNSAGSESIAQKIPCKS